MKWQTVLSGVLALALLEAGTSSTAAAGRIGSLLSDVAGLISHALSPTVPAIPDLRHRATTATPTDHPASSGSTTMPADWSTSASSLYV